MMTTYIIIFISASLISAFSQILLKKAALVTYSSWIYEYLNVRVISAYAIFFAATILTVYCYKVVPLSLGAMLEASGYVFVTILGRIMLKEKVSKRKIAGMALVIAGVMLVV
ncbi:MAG: multidrug ABC transporter [Lachnospiraceae bacterium]|nr:multidrug ABC transporter [Lachnospiraceae bacterium]